jgi:hypothetical protein
MSLRTGHGTHDAARDERHPDVAVAHRVAAEIYGAPVLSYFGRIGKVA